MGIIKKNQINRVEIEIKDLVGNSKVVIDSLQLTANQKVATPANWTQGEDCVVLPTIATEEIPGLFPKGFTEVTPYLRTTPQPVDLP